MMQRIILILSFFFILSSCSEKFSNCQQAQEYIENADNGLTKIMDYTQSEGIVAELSFWPTLKSNKGEDGETACVIGNNLGDESQTVLPLKLHLKAEDGKDVLLRASKNKADYDRLHQELSFRFSSQIKAWSGEEELEILECLLENNYELSGDKTILIYLYLPHPDRLYTQDLRVQWNDDLFRLGTNDLVFEETDLKKFKERF